MASKKPILDYRLYYKNDILAKPIQSIRLSPRPPKPLNPDNDSAAGPAAGFIFQFQKALVLLAELQNAKDYISIELVDDAAAHKEDHTVIVTAQAKHSISSSGTTTLEDTSNALWRFKKRFASF